MSTYSFAYSPSFAIIGASLGKIFFGEDDVTNLTPEKRGVGLVFQNYALYPHMSVYENIAFGLRLKKPKLTEKEIKTTVREMLKLVNLVGFENHRGSTYLNKGVRPLSYVDRGFGNNGSDKTEGVISNTFSSFSSCG